LILFSFSLKEGREDVEGAAGTLNTPSYEFSS